MPSVLEKRAVQWRGEGRAHLLTDSLLLVGGTACAALAGVVWLDQLTALPAHVRQGFWCAGAGLLAAALWRRLLNPWKRLDERAALAAASRRHPQAGPYLVSAWELARGGTGPGTSAELARAHAERADDVVLELGAARAYDGAPSTRAKRAAAAGAAGLLSFFALGATPSLRRVLAPWRVVPLERYVTVAPGDASLERGRPARIEATWRDDSPVATSRAHLTLETKGAAGWRAVPWERVDARAASFSVPGLAEPLTYRLAWRDLRTRAYKLTPTLPPRLESLRARVHGPQPEHVALTAAEPLTVVRGAWVVVSGSPNQPLAKAQLKLSNQPGPIALKQAQSGEYEAGFTVAEDATLELDLETPDGRRDPEPAVYRLVAKADEPPKVELISPLEPVQASPADVLPLAYSARDDGGLSRLTLLIRAKGRAPVELPLGSAGGRRDLVAEYGWDLSGLPRGRVEFQVKAYDTASTPQAGLSQTGVLDLVDFDTAHQRMEQDWLATQERLKALAAREQQAQKLAEAKDGAALERAQADLAKEWSEASKQFSSLAEQMQQDPYGNPGVAEQAQRLAEDIQSGAKEDAAEAERAAKAGDFPSAAEAHERQARRAKLAERTLDEGRKVQGLQDFYTHAGRMGHASAAVKAAVEAAANAGKATPEEKARLEAALGKVQRQLEELQKVLERMPKVDPNTMEAQGRRQLSVPLDGARQAAEQLGKAMASGDMAGAARAAQKLAEQLEQIQRAIGEAAAQAAAASPARAANAKAEKVEAMWSEAVEQQTAALESVQRIEDERLEKRQASDKALLEALARDQKALAEETARASGAPTDALAAMQEAADELAAGKARRSPDLMRAASLRLRSVQGGVAEFRGFAAREDALRERLEAPRETPAAPQERSQQAGRMQKGASEKTQALSQELSALSSEMPLPPALGRQLSNAQAKQREAEERLSRGDTSGAAQSQQEALKLLSEGGQGMSGAAGGQRSAADGMAEPFARPGQQGGRQGGGRGQRGANMGLVPLPSARDYKPPRELREELERSLQEGRPPADDSLIKEYFKRISQ